VQIGNACGAPERAREINSQIISSDAIALDLLRIEIAVEYLPAAVSVYSAPRRTTNRLLSGTPQVFGRTTNANSWVGYLFV
jgi:hypothetical protein